MALLPQEWTISAAVVELGLGKESISKLIAEARIDPVRVRGRSNLYYLADIVAAMESSGSLSAQQEKAKLDQERRRKLSRENDIAEKMVAPMGILTEALEKISRQIVTRLEALPLNIKKRCPQLTSKDIEWIRKEIAQSRNLIAKIEL